MENDKKWLLMTYYCPTHGDAGIIKPIELKQNEIREKILKKNNVTKN